ncbi:MAG: valine--tRNA ligase, partial [Ruminococcus sp.]|nr:valine--tRNA ligase [Ruminococcus sp.]
ATTEIFEIDGAVTVVTEAAKLYIPMNELVDMEAERKRLNKELEQTEKMLKQDEGKLSNPGFMGKAPAAVIEKIKNQAEREREKIALIKAAIENLK